LVAQLSKCRFPRRIIIPKAVRYRAGKHAGLSISIIADRYENHAWRLLEASIHPAKMQLSLICNPA
jgi:hypothetical protein